MHRRSLSFLLLLVAACSDSARVGANPNDRPGVAGSSAVAGNGGAPAGSSGVAGANAAGSPVVGGAPTAGGSAGSPASSPCTTTARGTCVSTELAPAQCPNGTLDPTLGCGDAFLCCVPKPDCTTLGGRCVAGAEDAASSCPGGTVASDPQCAASSGGGTAPVCCTGLAASTPTGTPPIGVTGAKRICDGSDDLRFVDYVGGIDGRTPEDAFFGSMGSSLFVDGHCHFWASGPGQWADPVEGVLDAAREQALHDAFAFDDLGALTCPPSNAQDAGYEEVLAADAKRSCAIGFSDGASAHGDVLSVIVASGTAITTGPVRIAVEATHPSFTGPTFDWPLATPVSAFVVQPSGLIINYATKSFAILDPGDAQKLRDLRAQALADPTFQGAILLTSGEALLVRDDLPIFDAVGYWDGPPG